ncbi:MAG: thiolase [Betaproteobacteria bacterium RIFCSPLOWO2_12_FULL_62_58]|nr:MAG: thiolase [Betaproteobacteria bacterium RIFCSPLOWO2_12_FULL_62_58]
MGKIHGRYAIVGVGMSPRSTNSGKTPLRMALEASRAALAEAGMHPTEVDCILSYHENDSCSGHWLATYLGTRASYYNDIYGGGGSTEVLIAEAIGLIEAGIAKTCLLFRSMNGRSGKRMGGGQTSRGNKVYGSPGAGFLVPYGVSTPGERYGFLAVRHMHETGLTQRDMGTVAVTLNENAQRNPAARFYGRPLTLERYLEEPYISFPFRKFDYCVETDEANAIIVTSAERARNCKTRPVYIKAITAHNATRHAHQYALPDILEVGGCFAAPRIFQDAEVSPSDIQVAAIYDCFTWVVLYQLEVYGFVKRGEAGAFAASGQLKIGGKLPINTAGGMLTEGYTHGMNNVIELVRQVRHDYEGASRQVPGCELGMSTGWGGPTSAGAMIVHN